MHRLFRIGAALTQLFVLVIAIIVLARPSPSTALKMLFTGTDGLPCQQPCLLGIRPETPVRDVFKVLYAHPQIQPATQQSAVGYPLMTFRGLTSPFLSAAVMTITAKPSGRR